MSKKLARLLGAVLVVMLAFSAAAFGATAVKVTVNPTGGEETSSTVTQVNPVTIKIAAGGVLSERDNSTGVIGVKGTNGENAVTDLSSAQTVTALAFTYDPDGEDGQLEAEDVTLSGKYDIGTATVSETSYTITIAADGTLGAVKTEDRTELDNATFTATWATATKTLTLTVSDANVTLTPDTELSGTYGEPTPFNMEAAATITGVLASFDGSVNETEEGYTAPTTETAANYDTVFLANADAVLTGKLGTANDPSTICLSYDKDLGNQFYYNENDNIVELGNGGVISTDEENGNSVFNMNLRVTIEEIHFDSSDITVFDGVSTQKTSASKTKTSAQLYVALSADVSIDIAETDEVISVSWDSDAQTADTNGYYVISSKDMGASGDKKVVVIKFKDGLDSCDFTLTLVVSGDSSSSETSETETYLLKVSDITLTPANAVSNTAKLISADTDNYSANSEPDQLNSTASGDWGSFAEFTASSDYLGGSFSVTVSTDATLVNVYVKNGTAWDEVDTEEVSGKVITPNTIGTYKVVLSADLVASSDKTVSGDAYFAFDFTVASVDAPAATGDVVVNADNASADPTGGVGGNPVIAGGQKIDTKFLSGTSISQSAFASFFSSATTVTMLSETELAAALGTLGLDETYMGNATEGYKALAFELPSGFTLTANEKFFVLLTTNDTGTGSNYLGIGVVPPALNGLRTMVIVFRLLKNPAATSEYMTFGPNNYFVGATNDTASADTSSSTRAVFVTADGVFNIKSEEATLLQGQTASGTATPVEDSDDDDDDNQETSSHGSSSGCDAGFGALSLLAVAGALAARKVRK